jgi:YD repeat-containing protein
MWKVTRVTDPFGRSATLKYDERGRLQRTTDTIGLTSSSHTRPMVSFRPDGAVWDDAVRQERRDPRSRPRVTDPLGGKERVEYHATDTGVVDSGAPVPTVAGATFTSDCRQFRNSY